ncbi:BI1-like protein, partial [Trifolium medium]|nr:BI1-like protein [Trifolium medium]
MSRKIDSEGVVENLERSLCPAKLEKLEKSVCPTMLENPQLRCKTSQGFVLYIVLIFLPFIAMYPLYYYYDRKHPLSYVLLLIFNVSSAIPIGLTCAFVS